MRTKKKLLSILLILIFSCTTHKYEFENIEIMSYYYHYDNDSKLILDRILYSYINPNGLSQTMRKTNTTGKQIYYESKINPKILNRIISETKNKDENYFNHKNDTLGIGLYCGSIIRLKITNKNSRTLSFTFEEDKHVKKLSTYYNLYKKLFNDSLNIRYIDESFLIKQKEFEKFVIHKDTSELQLPGPPQMNIKIKFIKPNN
jgi:hypothetical protein